MSVESLNTAGENEEELILRMSQLMGEKFQALRELMTFYRCAMMETETKIRVLNEEFSLKNDRNPIEAIKTRLKSPESIMGKLKARGLEPTLENIENGIADIAGVRVICAFCSDIYMIADALLSQDDVRLIEKKDYIKNPKDNGYRSLHLIVETPIFLHNSKKLMKVEIQLRTLSMDWWASLEHKIIYKKDVPVQMEDSLAAELRQCADAASALDKRIESIARAIDKANRNVRNPQEESS